MRVTSRFVGLDPEGRVVEEKVITPEQQPDSAWRAAGKLVGGVLALGSILVAGAMFVGAAVAVGVTFYEFVRDLFR